jgi:hypothetical protein
VKRVPTFRQAQYLAFIAQHQALLGAAPSEADIADFFGVSGPSAHQMLVALEARSFLYRIPGIARSSRLAVPLHTLPLLGGPGHSSSEPAEALTTFALYLARRLAARNVHEFAKFAAIHRLAARLEEILSLLGSPPQVLKRSVAAVTRLAKQVRRGPRRPSRAPSPPPPPPQRKPKAPPVKPPSGQGSLF